MPWMMMMLRQRVTVEAAAEPPSGGGLSLLRSSAVETTRASRATHSFVMATFMLAVSSGGPQVRAGAGKRSYKCVMEEQSAGGGERPGGVKLEDAHLMGDEAGAPPHSYHHRTTIEEPRSSQDFRVNIEKVPQESYL